MYLIVDAVSEFESHLDRQYLQRLAEAVLAGEGRSGESELSLTITTDGGIRDLNRQYRGIDGATDVLSFSLVSPPGDQFVAPPDGIVRLGDIVLSYEHVLAQAQQLGHPVRQELGELFVHGLLHILGYDHESDSDAQIMAEKAEKYLQ